jgi:hypothetical protein
MTVIRTPEERFYLLNKVFASPRPVARRRHAASAIKK